VAVSLSHPGSQAEASAAGDPLLRVSDVFKIYKEGGIETVALRGASLELWPGELVSLIGPSGSGKTSLLWLMAGLSLPSAGQVVFHGQDLSRLDEAERAAVRSTGIGVVFQRGNLIPFLTAEENLLMALRIRGGGSHRARARELLAAVGLTDRRRHYPRQLSGGETQRVAVALALVNEPELLLGDEVTGELDTATAEEVMLLLRKVQRERNMAMLVVTHNPRLAQGADRRLEIADGVVRQR
jgi:ABC-type lipoprotein export system ATPase subunit